MSFSPAPRDAPLSERLLAFPFAKGLTARGHGRLLDATASRRLDAGTHLLDEGVLCEALLLVERGAIRVYKTAPQGREITLYRVDPGESCVLGTSCVLRETRYPAQAATQAVTDALAVPAPVFRSLFSSEPSLQRFVVDLFSERLGHLMLLVDEVAFRRMDERLAGFLLGEARKEPGALYPIRMSHDEIAAQLGTAREVVSRLLSQFESEGMVQLERRMVRVKSVEALQTRTPGPQD